MATGSAIGRPIPRVDARLKVTGQAPYTADAPVKNPAFGFLVTSPIALGRVTRIEEGQARAVPGVLDILTYRNVGPAIKPGKLFANKGYMGTTIAPLASDKIAHDGQIVALVVADTFEAAREAAYKLQIDYAEEKPAATFDRPGAKTVALRDVDKEHKDPAVGDAEAAFARAAVKVDARYATPTQHHNPLELFATTCAWSDGKLTVWESSQNVYGYKNGLAQQLDMSPDDIRVLSPYIGGAFGSRGSLTQRTAIVALAAKRIGRPVKMVPTRSQGFTIATYRAETRHHIKLAADRDGKLVAFSHEGWEVTSRPDNYNVAGTEATTRIYACPNVSSKVNLVHADRNTPGFMRSPPEVPYVFALESAMDELAVALNMDPVALRKINDTQKEPIKGLPYTSRSLVKCLDAAADAFGWKNRNPKPQSMRDGDWLIGWGCATALYPTQLAPASARVTLAPDGAVRVQTASHDIGTGAYTVVAQTAADRLSVSMEKVTVDLGDSNLPPAPVSGGSITTASVCNAVAKACDQINQRRAQGVNGALEAYAEYLPHGAKPENLKGLYRGQPGITGGSHLEDRIQFAFGAEFVEVRVHVMTGEVRVPRMVGAFAAGTIVNPLTAESQLMGGLIWGASAALHEATEIDERAARYYNTDLAEYLIPVNADVPDVQVILIPEEDKLVNDIGIKGVGELGNVGTNAAVANAVYHATGVRIRELPIRIEKLIGNLTTT